MVGFALIVVVVMIILLIFLGFAMRKSPKELRSNEVTSFSSALLTYTTECAEDYEPRYYNLGDLIIACNENKLCSDGAQSCDVLKEDVTRLLEKSWGNRGDIKGYELKITTGTKNLLMIKTGTNATNYKTNEPELIGSDIKMYFKLYF